MAIVIENLFKKQNKFENKVQVAEILSRCA